MDQGGASEQADCDRVVYAMEGQPYSIPLVEEFIMKPEDVAHHSVNRFVDLAYGKYIAGQDEHGGCLVKKSKDLSFALAHIEEEIIDLWHYVQAVRMAHGGKPKRADVEMVEQIMSNGD